MFARFTKFIEIFLIAIAISSASASSAIEGRVNHGIDADNNHDFAVRIHSVVDQASPNAYLSTGVALSATVVVTVAQAIAPYTIWFVFSGGVVVAEQNFQESRTAFPHTDYNPNNLNNNIGVILLSTPLTNFIPIGLPGATIGAYQLFGYGFTELNQFPTVLQTLPITAITNEACANIYGSALVTENNFCGISAQPLGQTTNGDQGGPLIPMFLAVQASGIISFWGFNETLPIVFERIHAYADFLDPFLS